MSRLSSTSTTPIPCLRLRRRLSSTSTSRPSRCWDSRAAFAAATERVRAGTLSPVDAHQLFDELLGQANPVPERDEQTLVMLPKQTFTDGTAVLPSPQPW